jgi:hypothetical protein
VHHSDYDNYLAAGLVGAEGDRRRGPEPDGCITRLIGLAMMVIGAYWLLARMFH